MSDYEATPVTVVTLKNLVARDIPATDREFLRNAAGIKSELNKDGEAVQLPLEIRQEYWTYKLYYDRIESGAIPPFMLAEIVRRGLARAGAKVETTEKPRSIKDMLKDGDAVFGDRVEFKYRNQTLQGELHGMASDGKRILCCADGQAEDREIAPELVRLLPKELAAVGGGDDDTEDDEV